MEHGVGSRQIWVSGLQRLRVLATGRLRVVQRVAGQESIANLTFAAIADMLWHPPHLGDTQCLEMK